MFLETDFPAPVPSFQFPVPLEAADPGKPPYVCVKFNVSYLPYVLGALLQLALKATWDTDDQTAMDGQIGRINDLIYIFQLSAGGCVDTTPHIYESEENLPPFRMDCDGKLYVTDCNGTEHCIAYCADIPQSSTPPSGSPQPAPGGGSQTYCKHLDVSKQVLLDTLVNTGDVIHVTSVTGGGYDGSGLLWYCPNGQTYLATECVGPQAVSLSGDPVPAAHHMSLVAKIGSSYYSLETALTVPSGVSNAQVLIQVNDSNITDNIGGYDFCVKVTNNQAATWRHVFDFALAPGSWTQAPDLGHNRGVWVGGSGWQSQAWDDSGLNVRRDGVVIYWNVPAGTVVNTVEFIGYYGDSGGTETVFIDTSAGSHSPASPPSGAFDFSFAGLSLTAGQNVGLIAQYDHASTGAPITPQNWIYKCIMTGTGVEPTS